MLETGSPDKEMDITEYLRIFSRQRWTIVCCLAAAVALTFIYTEYKIPVYKASAIIRIKFASAPRSIEDFFSSRDQNLESELKSITSSGVLKNTALRMGLIGVDSSPLDVEKSIAYLNSRITVVSQKGTKDLVKIDFAGRKPENAVFLANTLIEVYKEAIFQEQSREAVEVRRFVENQIVLAKGSRDKAQQDLIKFQESEKARAIESGELLKSKLANLQMQLPVLIDKYTENHLSVINQRKQIKEIEGTLKKLPVLEAEKERLKMEVTMAENEIITLNTRYKKALISEAQNFSPVTVINFPMTPENPVIPNKPLNMMVGIIAGLMAGLGFASIRDNLDTSMGTIEEVEGYLHLPVLGMIPFISINGKGNGDPDKDESNELISRNLILYSPTSVFAEAYRRFQVSMRVSGIKEGASKVVLFTSTISGEGKTLTASNFAIICAQSNLKVLLLDMDFRKPAIHQMFGVEREPGLTDLVVNSSDINSHFKEIKGRLNVSSQENTLVRSNLKVITCGTIPYNPSNLINSKDFKELIGTVRSKFDLVVLNSPPIFPVSDAILLSEISDGVVLVYQVGKVAKGMLNRAVEQLKKIKTPILGVVLNETKSGATNKYYYNKYYNYYYDYNYSNGEEQGERTWWHKIKRFFSGKRHRKKKKSPENHQPRSDS